MKMFKSTTTKSNLLVFIFFLVLTTLAVMFSGCDDEPKDIIVIGRVADTTNVENKFVSDSIYMKNIQYIDSIKKNIK